LGPISSCILNRARSRTYYHSSSNIALEMQSIQPRASERISIQWAGSEAAEETDTLVLTFPTHYLDLRVYRQGHPQQGRIEWAQAGEVKQIDDGAGEYIRPSFFGRLTLLFTQKHHPSNSSRSSTPCHHLRPTSKNYQIKARSGPFRMEMLKSGERCTIPRPCGTRNISRYGGGWV
jgi:hypothetical protein